MATRERVWRSIITLCATLTEMGHGVPPIQQALDQAIRPSLSADVETEIPSDFFGQMRAVFTLQRMLLLARQWAGEQNLPPLLTGRDVIACATIKDARDNGLERKVGTLTPGKEADILMLRMDRINALPVNNVYGTMVLRMDTSNVEGILKIRRRFAEAKILFFKRQVRFIVLVAADVHTSFQAMSMRLQQAAYSKA